MDGLTKMIKTHRMHFSALILTKEEKLAEMGGILQIYKIKLSDSAQLHHKKDAYIDELLGRLARLNSRIEERDAALQDGHEKLSELEGRIKGLENELGEFARMGKVRRLYSIYGS